MMGTSEASGGSAGGGSAGGGSAPGRSRQRGDRRALRGRRAARRRALGITAAGMALLLVGYGTADALDAVPGVLTLEEPIEIPPLPQLHADAAPAAGAPPVQELSTGAPIPQDVADLLEPILRQEELTGALGADIRDALTGDVLFSTDAQTARTPASVTKVLTAAAALGELGASSRFTTTTRLAGDTVHLVGGGDVLLGAGESDPSATIGHAGLATLAQETASALRAAGVTAVQVSADLSRYSGPDFNAGWTRSDIDRGYIAPIVPLMVDSGYTNRRRGAPRHEDPAGAAVAVFVEALAQAGITAQAASAQAAPADAVELAAVDSAPVSAIVGQLLRVSDNVVSEVMGREVAIAQGREGAAAESPAAVIAALAAQQLDTGSIELVDTSGLDYGNRISAHDLTVILLAAAQADGDLSHLIPSFPAGGLSGTLVDRYTDPDTESAAGRVNAKTGSLRTVTSLAGTVLTSDGRLLVFSLLADDLDPGTAYGGRRVLDQAVTALADCGCP